MARHARIPALATLALTLLAAGQAAAHTGVGATASLAAGLGHPLLGLDHLLAMIAVGVWAGVKGGRAIWLVPGAFLAGMVLGGAAAVVGVALPLVELGIVGSVILLGLAIALDLRLATPLAMAAVALFGTFHGHAHGSEMPADGGGLLYAAGFMIATVGLHIVGIAIGVIASRDVPPVLVRVGGAAVAALGVLLLAQA